MISLFLGLTGVNLLLLLTAAVLGYSSIGGDRFDHWHVLTGAMSAITCCAVHCVVFTYFIATAKWVQHAITVKNLDAALSTPTRSFKAQAFPAALLAMGSVFVTAILGVLVDSYEISSTWHHIPALLAIVVNLAAAVVEYHAITRNGRLIDQILAIIGPQDPA